MASSPPPNLGGSFESKEGGRIKPVKLAAVKRAFARWRAKKSPGQAVPEELWDRTVAPSKVHGPTRIAAELRLNHSTLNKKIDGAAAPRSSPSPEFSELPLGQLRPPESTLELEDVTGTRLRHGSARRSPRGGGGRRVLGFASVIQVTPQLRILVTTE